AVPGTPSLVAVIVADPTPWLTTRPVLETRATFSLLLLHKTARPVSTSPAESSVCAARVTALPNTSVSNAGVTLTLATGTSATVTDANPCWPSTVAVMTAEPTPAAVTRPVPDTVATVVLFDFHVTVRPVRLSVLPSESWATTPN